MDVKKAFSMEQKVALITGAVYGIGFAIAEAYAAAGAKICFNCLSAEQRDKALEDYRAKGIDAHGYVADCTKEDQVRAGLEKIVEVYGHIDVVVNNAGVCYHKDIFEATVEEFREVLDINLTGEYIVAREAARIMIDKKIEGSVINIASMSAYIANVPQKQVAYNASKAGVIHMTRSLAVELVETGIRFNSISPGYVATPMSIDPNFVPPELLAAWEPLFPMHRMAKPEELVGAIIWLASDASKYANGTDILIDGLYTAV